nr:hypothetical protein [uncultured bacterium]
MTLGNTATAELKPLERERSKLVAIVLALALLCLVAIPLLVNERAIRMRDREIELVAPFERALDRMDRSIVDIDREQRGYLLTRRHEFLLDFASIVGELTSALHEVRRRAPILGPEVERVTVKAAATVETWLREFAIPIEASATMRSPAAALRTMNDRGRVFIENARGSIEQVRTELARRRIVIQRQSERYTRWSLLSAVLLGVVAVSSGAYLFHVARVTSALYRRAFDAYRNALGKSSSLEAQLSFTQTLIRHAPMAIAVVDAKEGVVKLGNHAFERLPFLASAEALERKLSDVLLKGVGAEPFLEAAGRAAKEDRHVYLHADVEVNAPGLAASYWMLRAIPFEKHVLLIWEDVTPRKRAYDALELEHRSARKIASEFQIIVDNMGDGVIVVNRAGEVILLNPQARSLLGVAADLRLPQPMSALNLKIIEPLDASRWASADLSGSARVAIFSSTGGRLVEVVATPVRDEHGAIVSIVGVVHDITEMKKSEREKDEFLALASHEIKTPLTVLDTSCQVISMALKARRYDQVEVAARHFQAQLRRLKLLVFQVFDFANLQADKMQLRPERVDLRDVLKTVVEEDRVLSSQHLLSLKLPDVPVPALIDAPRIEQVLNILISNAIRYSPPGSRIEVELEPGGSQLRICVVDHGIGIGGSRRSHRCSQPRSRASS